MLKELQETLEFAEITHSLSQKTGYCTELIYLALLKAITTTDENGQKINFLDVTMKSNSDAQRGFNYFGVELIDKVKKELITDPPSDELKQFIDLISKKIEEFRE